MLYTRLIFGFLPYLPEGSSWEGAAQAAGDRSRMNILLIHPHDVRSPEEPWTRRITAIASFLYKRKHAVKVVYAPLMITARSQRHWQEGIEFIEVSRYSSPYVLFKNLLTMVPLVRWSDVVHLQKCHYYTAVPALLLCYAMNKPLHYDWDDWEEKIWLEACGRRLHSLGIAFLYRLLELALPFLADSTTCASRHLKKLALQRGARPFLIKDSPVGVDLEKFTKPVNGASLREKYQIRKDQKIILYVGQLHSAQYVDLLLKAAVYLNKQRAGKSSLIYMIVGAGVGLPRLMALAEEAGVSGQCIFTGAVPSDDVVEYIDAADICVAPFCSTAVTLCKSPLKIVEYMSRGKYIVASAVGEVVQMLGGCGYLTQEGSFQEIAEGIRYFLENGDDEAFRKDVQDRLRKRVEHRYTWDYTVENLLALYSEITG